MTDKLPVAPQVEVPYFQCSEFPGKPCIYCAQGSKPFQLEGVAFRWHLKADFENTAEPEPSSPSVGKELQWETRRITCPDCFVTWTETFPALAPTQPQEFEELLCDECEEPLQREACSHVRACVSCRNRAIAEATQPQVSLCKCGHPQDEHDNGRLCCSHKISLSLMCLCMEYEAQPQPSAEELARRIAEAFEKVLPPLQFTGEGVNIENLPARLWNNAVRQTKKSMEAYLEAMSATPGQKVSRD